MGSVVKTVGRAATAAFTGGLSEVAGGIASVAGGGPSAGPANDAAARSKITPVTDVQKKELAEQEFNKQRKARGFTTLLTSRGQRGAAFSTLTRQLQAGPGSKDTLG